MAGYSKLSQAPKHPEPAMPSKDTRRRPSPPDAAAGPSTSTAPLYTDGKTMPIPNRPDHPVHIPTGTVDVLTFYPTLEEFTDFNGYIKKIEAVGAHRNCGICKIVPPAGWHPRPDDKDYSTLEKYVIKNPVRESFTGKDCIFEKCCTVHDPARMSVAAFKKLAESKRFANPNTNLTGLPLEKVLFGKLTAATQPIYGADTEGTLMTAPGFNISNLGTILDETKELAKIPGVNTVYLYFGMYRASFAWHVEDMELYSINYLHFGAPKYWFAIPPESAERFEKLMEQYYPEEHHKCKAFLRHKSYLITPELLKKHNIPYGTMQQNPNEFIITFPKGYHMGFNLGFNCAESTNFATDRWIDFGKDAVLCNCGKSRVEISMVEFMKKYRPTEFPSWQDYWYSDEPVTPVKSGKRRLDAADCSTAGGSKKSRLADIGSSVLGPGSNVTTIGSLKIQPLASDDIGTIGKQKAWRARIGTLCSDSAPDFEAEKNLNQCDALLSPHCSVCNYFEPLNPARQSTSVPPHSKRNTAAMCFAKDDKVNCNGDSRADSLITCSSCQVTVHPDCYCGAASSGNRKWLCLRCKDRPAVVVHSICCCFCEMRGGALIPCQNGSDNAFAHVICAIMNRQTSFDRVFGPTSCFKMAAAKHLSDDNNNMVRLPTEYVTQMGTEHERGHYECGVCGYQQAGLVRCDLCPEEVVKATLNHATCARLAGYRFEKAEYPLCTIMVCDKHKSRKESAVTAKFRTQSMPQGATVIGKSKKLSSGPVSRVDGAM